MGDVWIGGYIEVGRSAGSCAVFISYIVIFIFFISFCSLIGLIMTLIKQLTEIPSCLFCLKYMEFGLRLHTFHQDLILTKQGKKRLVLKNELFLFIFVFCQV